METSEETRRSLGVRRSCARNSRTAFCNTEKFSGSNYDEGYSRVKIDNSTYRQKILAISSLDGSWHLIKWCLRLSKPDAKALLLFHGHVQRRDSRNAIGNLGRMLIVFGVLSAQIAEKLAHSFGGHVGHVHAALAALFGDQGHHFFGDLGAFLGLQLREPFVEVISAEMLK